MVIGTSLPCGLSKNETYRRFDSIFLNWPKTSVFSQFGQCLCWFADFQKSGVFGGSEKNYFSYKPKRLFPAKQALPRWAAEVLADSHQPYPPGALRLLLKCEALGREHSPSFTPLIFGSLN